MDEREIEHIRKQEYNRGWTDARSQRATETWQLDRERRKAIDRLKALELDAECGSHACLSAIASAIMPPATAWTYGACEALRTILLDLLGDEDAHEAVESIARIARGYRARCDCDCAGGRDVPDGGDCEQEGALEYDGGR